MLVLLTATAEPQRFSPKHIMKSEEGRGLVLKRPKSRPATLHIIYLTNWRQPPLHGSLSGMNVRA